MTKSSSGASAAAFFLLLTVLLPMAGCGSFFTCDKASCPASGSTGSTGSTGATGSQGSTTTDYAYVANSSAGVASLSEYSIGGGTLSSLGSINLGYIPVALAVSPNDNFLYVASVPGATNPGIYRYVIGDTGALSADNGGNVVASDTVAAMAISPDGNWLYTVNVDGFTLLEYSVNPTTGALGQPAALSLLSSSCTLTVAVPVSQSCSVTVAQSGHYVVVSLGVAGSFVYDYTSSSGITTNSGAAGNGVYLLPSNYSVTNPVGNFSAVVNSDDVAFVAQTNSVSTYELQSSGYENPQGLTYPAGSAPRSITLNPAGTFMYTANESAGSISAFAVENNGGITTVTGSPFAGPANVSAIAVDKSGGYLVGVGYDANVGVRLYSVSSAGVLTQVDQVGSGANEAYPALVAVTH